MDCILINKIRHVCLFIYWNIDCDINSLFVSEMKVILQRLATVPRSLLRFYYEGFKTQKGWSRQVWIVILIKLFIMFFVLKLFFFPNFLKTKYTTDQERGDYVIDQLTKP